MSLPHKRSIVYQALHLMPGLLRLLPSAALSQSRKNKHFIFDESYWAELSETARRQEVISTSIAEIEITCDNLEVFVDGEW